MIENADFAYLLRYVVDPDAGAAQAIAMLDAFVRDAGIDDVTMFTECEELSAGHLTSERQQRLLPVFSQIKEQLTKANVGFSINHWTTLYHSDRGRRLLPGQQFGRMVDIHGRMSDVSACPLCPDFRAYYLDLIRRFGALSPNIFWIEDDFRFHNHEPLTWGGCFCETHMAEYQRRASETFTREAFVRGVLAPGNPHHYRKIWLDTCRDALLGFAREMREAMAEVSPGTRLGLMSSNPSIHCAEGRDWDALMEALCAGSIPHRIHLPSYLERTPQEYLWLFNTVSMPCRAVGPEAVEIYPELENFPFTPFAKSLAFTRFQIELSLALRVRGTTLDLFDVNGAGIHPDDGHASNLREAKPFLNACNRLLAGCADSLGITVLVCPNASYSLHTQGDGMEALYPRETFFGGLLGAMGIPFAFRRDHKGIEKQFVAVSGQYFRNLTSDDIHALFEKNFMLLDGEAAQTLFEMGLGELAGICGVQRVAHETGVVCYEESVQPEEGFATPRAGAQVFLGDQYLVDYAPCARAVSRFMRYDREVMGNGLTVFAERVMVLPFLCEEYPGGLLHRLRQLWIQRELLCAANRFALPAMVVRAANLCAYAFSHAEGLVLFLANASTDPVEEVRLVLPGCEKPSEARALRDKHWERLSIRWEGDTAHLILSIKPLRCGVLIL